MADRNIGAGQIEEFLHRDPRAFYTDLTGVPKPRGFVCCDPTRLEKAKEQAALAPTPHEAVIDLVNEFSYLLRGSSVEVDETPDSIELDGVSHQVVGNVILAKGLVWDEPRFDKAQMRYVSWDHKYDLIAQKFGLESASNLLWIKFANSGHVAVIARGFDINFSKGTTSQRLVEAVGGTLDKGKVMIMPLSRELLGDYTTSDVELALGNFLIRSGVAVVDYYSHQY